MWAAIANAVVALLLAVLKTFSQVQGDDVSAKPGSREKLQVRLEAWKKANGAL